MLVELEDDRLGVRLFVKHDDNKRRKLKYNLLAAREQGHHTLVTFGGAYSNHIRATATVGRLHGFTTVGVIRGEEHLPLNPVLRHATDQGMRLTYLDRASYRRKELPDGLGEHYLLPEGGSNELAVLGCAELGVELGEEFEVVSVPAGTGGTLAGLAAGLKHGRALGFSVLKGGEFLTDVVAALQRRTYGEVRDNWSIETKFHFGGYSRTTPMLTSFLADFQSRHGLRLDPIYTGKMMYGLYALAGENAFATGARICAVLTGAEQR